ncbi:hypothetical protein SAY87_007634 [Trapa incisa]|uniref:Uncharacterized protein n=1 Tax=Trapa incisa TaxID=236973 RepID=A0AAN7QF71_9MYRT|nr:hypothetical protein SAY87_007634 [Trapa incisa]
MEESMTQVDGGEATWGDRKFCGRGEDRVGRMPRIPHEIAATGTWLCAVLMRSLERVALPASASCFWTRQAPFAKSSSTFKESRDIALSTGDMARVSTSHSWSRPSSNLVLNFMVRIWALDMCKSRGPIGDG